MTIYPGDYILGQCSYSSIKSDKFTREGSTADDEMCNFYMMYYTLSRNPNDHWFECADEQDPKITKYLPWVADVPLPRNETLEKLAKGAKAQIQADTLHFENSFIDKPRIGKMKNFKEAYDWPDKSIKVGQVSGVALDTKGNVVIFHRSDRIWDLNLFNSGEVYQLKELGPINTDTVFTICSVTGKLLKSWGGNMFYLPHGISVDSLGNYWLTDIALHQVFKFASNKTQPSLVLGIMFEPGNDNSHFCKPTAVAAMRNGEFFVADGYCNSRIIKFNEHGERIMEWGVDSHFPQLNPPPYLFQVPHALALAEDKDLLCVADRNNGRIQCFKASDGTFQFQINSSRFGRKLVSVAYSPADGKQTFEIRQA